MRIAIGSLTALLLFLTIACSSEESAPKPSKTPPAPSGSMTPAANSNELRGGNSMLGQKPPESNSPARIFAEQKCSMCHGEDGKGKLKGSPDFTNSAWQRDHNDNELTEAIKMGKSPQMPAFGAKLKGDEIKSLVAYVRAFAKK